MLLRSLRRYISIATVKRQIIDTDIAELILSDPASRNAMGYDLTAAFEEHIRKLNTEPNISCVIIRSDSPKYFCSGGNLKERAKMTKGEVTLFTDRMRELIRSVERLPMPTIGLLGGNVVGGGCELALATDMRILAKGTNISLPQCRLGIVPGMGGITRLTKLVGPGRAKEIIFTGGKIDCMTALQFGIANGVEDTYDKARERCIKIAKDISKGSKVAIREAKQVFLKIAKNFETEKFEIEAYKRMIENTERQEALNKFVQKKSNKE